MENTHEILLETMVPYKNDTIGIVGDGEGTQKSLNSDGELVINADGDIECMQTAECYNLPLRIDVSAKTDSTNIRLYYKAGEVIFNWECCPDELRIHDVLTGNNYGYSNQGSVPINEYVDISWVIEKKYMDVFVNGELRHHEDGYPYMGLLMLEPSREISEPVRISSAWGSTVTVKSLTITELD